MHKLEMEVKMNLMRDARAPTKPELCEGTFTHMISRPETCAWRWWTFVSTSVSAYIAQVVTLCSKKIYHLLSYIYKRVYFQVKNIPHGGFSIVCLYLEMGMVRDSNS